MYISLNFFNCSPEVVSYLGNSHRHTKWYLGGSTLRMTVTNLQEAERLITACLAYAQSVRVHAWGFRDYKLTMEARTNRQRWKGNIQEILPQVER